jgi:acetoin utilization deacetylase AcuC-like enzyme
MRRRDYDHLVPLPVGSHRHYEFDIGIHLFPIGDEAYLAILVRHLPAMLEQHRPDVMFYLAGADPYRFDQLGGLALTLDGLKRRDAFVVDTAREARVPLAIVLAGGYAVRTDDTIEIHCNTVRVAAADRP